MSVHEQRRKLKALRGELASELAQNLMANASPTSDLSALKTRLDLLDRLLTALTPDTLSRLKPPILVGALIALITTVSLVWRATFLPVIVDIEASAVSLMVAEPARIERVQFLGGMQVRGVDWATSPRIPFTAESEDVLGSAEVASTWLRLDEVLIPAKSDLELQATPESFTALISSNDAVRVSIQQSGKATMILGEQMFEFELTDPESIQLGTKERVTSPAALHTVEITGQPVDKMSSSFAVKPESLDFVERTGNETHGTSFVSSVLGGTLSVPAVGWKETIEPGDTLGIDGFTAESALITLTDKVHIRLRGVADDVRIGTGRFKRSLAPTMLEYLAKNYMVALLWSAVGLIGGLLWSVFRFFEN